jgi:threonine dehydratase
MIVEGSGAVGLAALRENPGEFAGKKVGLLVSGANIDAKRLTNILDGELE